MAGNIKEYFGLGDIAQRYIGLENSFFAGSNWFAQWFSIGAEDLREATARLVKKVVVSQIT